MGQARRLQQEFRLLVRLRPSSTTCRAPGKRATTIATIPTPTSTSRSRRWPGWIARRRSCNSSRSTAAARPAIAREDRQVAGKSAGDRGPVRRQTAVRVEALARSIRTRPSAPGSPRLWRRANGTGTGTKRRGRVDAVLARRGKAPRRRSRASLAWPEAASRQDLTALNAAIQGSAAVHTNLDAAPATARASCRCFKCMTRLESR